MKHYGFIYDMQRCLGCRACQLACKEENKLPPSVYFRRVKDCMSGSRQTTEDQCRSDSGQTTLRTPVFFYSGSCNHCQEPACVKVCPVGAMYADEEGLVRHNDSLCMGCGRCVPACPYGAVMLHPQTGLAAKCDACASRRAKGQPPACTEVCPTDALRFELIEDPHNDLPSGLSQRTVYGGPSILPEPDETLPSLMTLNVPLTLCRDTSAAEVRYFHEEMHSEAFSSKAENTSDAGSAKTNTASSGHLQEETADSGTDEPRKADILVIGGGIAGVSAALAAAEADPKLNIKVCGDEESPVCGRPLLSKCLLKGFRPGRYYSYTTDELKKRGIGYSGGRKAVRIDADDHRVLFSDGSSEYYRKCIIATGAGPSVPPIPGIESCEYMTLRQAADTELLRRRTLKARSAVMIGGGFIGLETAWQLKELGLAVTVLEAAPRLLGRLADRSTSDILVKSLNSKGLSVYTGITIKCLKKSGSRTVVFLTDGREIPADIVIVSTGVRANTEPAGASGAECGRGIKIDANCKTSLTDVFACGDCAETEDGIVRQNWTNSLLSGRAAGSAAVSDLSDPDPDKPAISGNVPKTSPAAKKPQDTDRITVQARNAALADSMMVNVGGIHILSIGTVPEEEDVEKMVLSWEDAPSYYQVNEPVMPWEKPGNGGELPAKEFSPAADRQSAQAAAGGYCEAGVSDLSDSNSDLFRMNENLTRAVFFFKKRRLTGLCALGSLKKLALLQDIAALSPDKKTVLEMLREGGISA